MALAIGKKAFQPASLQQATSRRPSLRPLNAAAVSEVPDINKRNIMNLLLLGGAALPVAGLAGPYALFFVPKSSGGGAGGRAAKDALGNDVKANAWLATHQKGDRSLTQGLKGDPTYLIVNDGQIEKYGLNGVCTHLGCVVPWNQAENKFKCPCHGSQYDATGKKVRGPAPLSLALAHTSIAEDDTVLFSPWTETDFRTDEAPWWN
eukprot:GHRR01008149.1.p1 GENE.GHRR01008149.1~~GHRR01008149.1.p1  ORF type:complete len:206 (-),score=31.44 GHRR01008149.1:1390-2007(-)